MAKAGLVVLLVCLSIEINKSVQEILRNVVYKCQCRLNVSNNDLVKCTLFRNVKEKSKLRKRWSRLILPKRLVAD